MSPAVVLLLVNAVAAVAFLVFVGLSEKDDQ